MKPPVLGPVHQIISPRTPLPSGLAGLDTALGGFPRGMVSEIMAASADRANPVGLDGTFTLLMPLVARLTGEGHVVAWVVPRDTFAPALFPPALAAAGVDLSRVILIQPRSRQDAQWAAEQCARSNAVSLTIAPLCGLRDLDIRRLALAAEMGGEALVLLRPAAEADRIVSAALRLGVHSVVVNGVRRIRVEVLRCRGRLPPMPFEMEVSDDQTLSVPLAPQPELRAVRA